LQATVIDPADVDGLKAALDENNVSNQLLNGAFTAFTLFCPFQWGGQLLTMINVL